MAMALKQEEMQIIGEYVQRHLIEWLPEQVYTPNKFSLPIELTERMVRVEEAIKHQGELIEKILHQMDKRFEQVDKRFEQVDKRFEQMQNYMDKNFNEVKSSIKSLETKMFQFMVWSFGFTTTVAGIIIAVIKFA